MILRVFVFSPFIVCLFLVLTACSNDLEDADAIEGPMSHREGEYIEQEQEERVLRGFSLEDAVRDTLAIIEVLHPGSFRIHNRALWISDAGDMKLKRYAFDGTFEGEVGEGRGEGPGEVQNIIDFSIEDDRIWIVDSSGRKIDSFSPEGEHLDRFSTNFFPTRLLRSSDRRYIFGIGSPSPFSIYDTEGELLDSFGEDLSEIDPSGLALQGRLIEAPHEGVLYAPRFASFLFYYDSTGIAQRVVQTIDREPFSEAREREGMTGAPNPPVQMRHASLHDGVLYLSSEHRDEERYFLDRYDWETGAYLDSHALDGASQWIERHEDELFVLKDTLMVRYALE